MISPSSFYTAIYKIKSVKYIISILFLFIPFTALSQEKEVISYHFEYGFGLSDFYSYPQRFEQDKIMPFPILDEYMVGIKFKKKDFEIMPMIGIVEQEWYDRKMVYKPTVGVVIKKKNLHFKISNGGFTLLYIIQH